MAPVPPVLTIRNLSSVPVQLKLVERSPVQGKGCPLNIFANSTTKATSNSTPEQTGSDDSIKSLADDVTNSAGKEVSIQFAPFQAKETGIRWSSQEVYRLTFEVGGQDYQLQLPSPTSNSMDFKPVKSNPTYEFTGVFVPDSTYLAIYSSANLECWMAAHSDAVPLSLLSIPGTHNSPTCHAALPSVRCQAVSPLAQLSNGVRFFDVRVQPERGADPSRDKLQLVHSAFSVALAGRKYLRPLLADVYSFLATHPSETVVLSVKREGAGSASDAHLSRVLHDRYVAPDPARWWTEPRIPRLGEARGRVVLLRRFALADELRRCNEDRGWGLDAQCWADNTPCDVHGAVCVQDFYQVAEPRGIAAKIGYATEQLRRSAALACRDFLLAEGTDEQPTPPPLYLNFLSASNFWKPACWPERVAAKMNPAVTRYLCVEHAQSDRDGCTGVVVMDWVGLNGDWDIVRCIVGMNARLLEAEREIMRRHSTAYEGR